MYFLLKLGIFHCYVSLPEGTPPPTLDGCFCWWWLFWGEGFKGFCWIWVKRKEFSLQYLVGKFWQLVTKHGWNFLPWTWMCFCLVICLLDRTMGKITILHHHHLWEYVLELFWSIKQANPSEWNNEEVTFLAPEDETEKMRRTHSGLWNLVADLIWLYWRSYS